ncbi:MAG TPA: hypothetical protein VIV11_12765 [Kofleriaceae bacterium]
MWKLAPLALYVLAGPSCIGPFGGCTLIGCGPIASVDIPDLTDESQLSGATIELCIEQRCVTGVVPAAPDMVGSGQYQPLSGDFLADVIVWRTESGVRVVVELSHADALENGDVYSATISANGTTLTAHTWTARYERTYPNGRGCDDGCVQATLTAQ